MYLIVGLGNPEKEYSNTRHNMGFDVINELSKENNIVVDNNKFKGLFGMGEIENQKVILFKPQTFMNLSGEAVVQVVNFYKIPFENIIVVYDDMDIDKENIRIKPNGSAGSHNGMKSVVGLLGTTNFCRVRVGIGRPENNNNEDIISYVISKVQDDEYKKLQKGIEKAKNAVCDILKNGVNMAMNKYN